MSVPFAIRVLVALTAVTSAAFAEPPRFALLDRDRFVDNALRVPGRTGAELLRALCFQPPPECTPGSSACSIAPAYPLVAARYDIRVERGRRTTRGRWRYRVLDVQVAPHRALRYPPLRGGHIQRWKGLDEGSRERELVESHLRRHAGDDEAELRLDALDRFADEVRWHEEQHVRHFGEYLAEYERIVNDPRGYPRVVVATSAARARAKVEAAIGPERDERLRTAARKLDHCVHDFHHREAQPGTYAALVGECACYGGEACRAPLPPFPDDFTCSFDAG